MEVSKEDLVNWLKISNKKIIAKRTKIPYDRIAKWAQGKGFAKSDDYSKLLALYNGTSSNFGNVTSGALEEPREPYPLIESQNKRKQDIVTPKGTLHTTGANKRKPEALIPFYNADFIAGNAELYYADSTIYPEYYMDVPEFSGCTAFRAYSDSMEKMIRSGSILFGVKLEDWADHLEYGQIYGITCTDGRRYLKRIRKSDKQDHFKLVSENPMYDEFELPKKKIKNVWLIEGWLDKRT